MNKREEEEEKKIKNYIKKVIEDSDHFMAIGFKLNDNNEPIRGGGVIIGDPIEIACGLATMMEKDNGLTEFVLTSALEAFHAVGSKEKKEPNGQNLFGNNDIAKA